MPGVFYAVPIAKTETPAPAPVIQEVSPDTVIHGGTITGPKKVFNWFATHPIKTEGMGQIFWAFVNFGFWTALGAL